MRSSSLGDIRDVVRLKIQHKHVVARRSHASVRMCLMDRRFRLVRSCVLRHGVTWLYRPDLLV